MSNSTKKNIIPQNKAVIAQHYQGVIPPPEMMEKFSEIDPSFPDRILKMAENEGIERRARERSIIVKSFILDILGLFTGVSVVAGVIWLCYQFILKGAFTEASVVASAVMVSLAAIFVTRKFHKQTNNNGK